MTAEVDSITGAKVFPQFKPPSPTDSQSPKIPTSRRLSEAQSNLGLCLFVPQRQQPFGHRLLAIVSLVSEDFNHVRSCSFRATYFK